MKIVKSTEKNQKQTFLALNSKQTYQKCKWKLDTRENSIIFYLNKVGGDGKNP